MAEKIVIPDDIILTRHAVARYRKYHARIFGSVDAIVDYKWIKAKIFPECKYIPIERMKNWADRQKRYPYVIYFLHEKTMVVFAVDVLNKCIRTCIVFNGNGAHQKPKSRECRAAEKKKVRQMLSNVLSRRDNGEEETYEE